VGDGVHVGVWVGVGVEVGFGVDVGEFFTSGVDSLGEVTVGEGGEALSEGNAVVMACVPAEIQVGSPGKVRLVRKMLMLMINA